jgi:hypothetical protein
MGKKHKGRTKEKLSRREDVKPSSNKTISIVIGVLVLSAIAFAFFYQRGDTKSASTIIVNPDTLPGIQISEAPWQSEFNHLRERLKIIGLPAMSEEGTVMHAHQHLDVFIKGKTVPVPAFIGAPPQFITTIHTHDKNGEIHIESPTVQTFTLGQFFDIWGVRFTSKCIGSYCEDQQNSIKVFVNGKAASGDPRSIELTDQLEIVIAYGTSAELPNPIPSEYQSSS